MAKLLSIVMVSVFLSFVLGYVKGCSDAQIKAQADKADDVVEVIQVQDEIDIASNEITEDFIDTDFRREIITKIIEIEVPKYVPVIQKDDSACNLTVGTECMLNARRANRLPEAECDAFTEAEKQTASKITEAAFIAADLQCADQYAELAGRCDALIDVVDGYQKLIARMRQGNDG